MAEKKLKSWGRSHAFRLPGENAGPGVVAVTWCTYERKPIKAGSKKITEALDIDIGKASHDDHARVLAICVMPDHVHMMISMDGLGSSLSKYVRVWKGLLTRRLAREKAKPFWQRSFYDHWIRKNEAKDYAAYIVANPVRKGLVKDWREYPYTRLYINFL